MTAGIRLFLGRQFRINTEKLRYAANRHYSRYGICKYAAVVLIAEEWISQMHFYVVFYA